MYVRGHTLTWLSLSLCSSPLSPGELAFPPILHALYNAPRKRKLLDARPSSSPASPSFLLGTMSLHGEACFLPSSSGCHSLAFSEAFLSSFCFVRDPRPPSRVILNSAHDALVSDISKNTTSQILITAFLCWLLCLLTHGRRAFGVPQRGVSPSPPRTPGLTPPRSPERRVSSDQEDSSLLTLLNSQQHSRNFCLKLSFPSFHDTTFC